MPGEEEIIHSKQLLVAHRRRLLVALRQQAELGILTPPGVVAEIDTARAQIADLKAALREAGVAVPDDPNDDALIVPQLVPRTAPEIRNRQRMIQKVHDFWVKGVLDQSLHGAALMTLGLTSRPDAVAYPWEMIVQAPDRFGPTLPPGTPITDVFDDLGGELLILGAPGAGKTTLLIALARDLLVRAGQDAGHPIPVVFNLSSWAVRRPSLANWLVDELNERYDVPRTIAEGWVAAEQILPLLDGLDEVALDYRTACVEAINAFRKAHGFLGMVVCSRVADYDALKQRLRVNGAVTIQPLTASQIDTYLLSAGEQLGALRATLAADTALRELAESPLMLAIMVLTYAGTSTTSPVVFETSAQWRSYLFDSYINRMYQRRGADRTDTVAQTRQWLGWFARMLQRQSQSVLFIEQLQPTSLRSRAQQRLYAGAVGVVATLPIAIGLGLGIGLPIGRGGGPGWVTMLGVGAAFGFVMWLAIRRTLGLLGSVLGGAGVGLAFGVPFGMTLGVRTGTFGGLALGLIVTVALIFASRWLGRNTGGNLSTIETVERLRWSWTGAVPGLIGGSLIGFVFGLILWYAIGRYYGLLFGVTFALGFAVTAALALGLFSGLTGRDIELKMVPNQGIWRSAANTIRVGLVVAVVVGIPIGLTSTLAWGRYDRTTALQIGLIIGISVGCAFGVAVALFFGGLACIQHLILRLLLVYDRCVPWNIARFLDDCAERVLLRKVGGGYIFIHRLLLEYFAAIDDVDRAVSGTAEAEV